MAAKTVPPSLPPPITPGDMVTFKAAVEAPKPTAYIRVLKAKGPLCMLRGSLSLQRMWFAQAVHFMVHLACVVRVRWNLVLDPATSISGDSGASRSENQQGHPEHSRSTSPERSPAHLLPFVCKKHVTDMSNSNVAVEEAAYLKLMLHAAKYPWATVNGFLLGEAGSGGQARTYDRFPLFFAEAILRPLIASPGSLFLVDLKCWCWCRRKA